MLLFTAILSLIFLALPGKGSAEEATLTFLQFNDVYDISPKDGVGGFAALMTALKQERLLAPHSVTIVSGDFLSPSLLSSITKGKQMIALFNAVGVDMVGFGNHEFDFGTVILKKRIAEACFFWLGSNIIDSKRKLAGCKIEPIFLKEIEGIKVGFMALVTPKTREMSLGAKSIDFEAPVEAAKKAVAKLQAQGAQVIVAITHLDIADDRVLAREVKGIDLILGGHDHSPISYYQNGVLILKSGTDAEYLGVIKLKVILQDGTAKVARIIPSWHMKAIYGLQPDASIDALVSSYTHRLMKDMDVAIGRTACALDTRYATVRGKESSFGDLIADALKRANQADVALINGGVIRGNRLYAAGSILTRGNISAELPFDDIAVVIDMPGKVLMEALEHGLSTMPKLAGGFPQIAGMEVLYQPKAAAGERVIKVSIGGKPLESEKIYRLATTNYLLQGGDGYGMLAKGKVIEDERFGLGLTNIVIEYIAQMGQIDPTEARLVMDKGH